MNLFIYTCFEYKFVVFRIERRKPNFKKKRGNTKNFGGDDLIIPCLFCRGFRFTWFHVNFVTNVSLWMWYVFFFKLPNTIVTELNLHVSYVIIYSRTTTKNVFMSQYWLNSVLLLLLSTFVGYWVKNTQKRLCRSDFFTL